MMYDYIFSVAYSVKNGNIPTKCAIEIALLAFASYSVSTRRCHDYCHVSTDDYISTTLDRPLTCASCVFLGVLRIDFRITCFNRAGAYLRNGSFPSRY